eukprot:scaffold38471_cov15-Tisochrysis_lutea.AAC.2
MNTNAASHSTAHQFGCKRPVQRQMVACGCGCGCGYAHVSGGTTWEVSLCLRPEGNTEGFESYFVPAVQGKEARRIGKGRLAATCSPRTSVPALANSPFFDWRACASEICEL